MIHSLHLWLRYLLWLAGLLSLLSIGILIVRIGLDSKSKHARSLDSYWRRINENLYTLRNQALMKKFSLVIVGVLYGVISGYMWGVVQQYNRLQVRHDLVITERKSARVYTYKVKQVEYQTTFCYPILFNTGDYIQWINYEEKAEEGCWMPRSYYINRERSLYGRNTNTYTDTFTKSYPNTYASTR